MVMASIDKNLVPPIPNLTSLELISRINDRKFEYRGFK